MITTTEGEYHTSIPLSNIEEKPMLEVYGRWTYTVKLKGTDRTALMTAQKYNELKSMYDL